MQKIATKARASSVLGVLLPGRSPAHASSPTTALEHTAERSATADHGFDLTHVATRATPQCKPVVGPASDPLEQEADHAADQVMRMAEPALSGAGTRIQRKCAACEDEERAPIQTKGVASRSSGALAINTRTAASTAARSGTPMPPALRSYFEPRFHHDFSGVRIHADAEAANAAKSVQARAYTLGHSIVFGSGEYSPTTPSGRHLLAHELAHVVQQGAASRQGRNANSANVEINGSSHFSDDGQRAPVGHSTGVHIARKPCLEGSNSCPAQIDGANDQTATGESKLDTNNKALERSNPSLIDLPSAWLVAKGSPWPAFTGDCPPDLVSRDNKAAPKASGQKDSRGIPDQCIFASVQEEAGAKIFLEDATQKTIGSMSREDWEHEARLISSHELAHIPVRRELQGKRTRGEISTDQFLVDIGPLNEAAAVLAELPLIYEFEKKKDPQNGKSQGVAQVRNKVQGAAKPPGSSYTIQGLMQRACCTIPCKDAKARMETLIDRANRTWTTEQERVIFDAFAQGSFCDGKANISPPKPAHNAPYFNPRLGPPA
jgi:Domain of unknown function (DUF4157)